MNWIKKYHLVAAIVKITITALPFNASSAQFTVKGKVYDSTTSAPIPYATVVIVKSGKGVLTDSLGNFRISTDLVNPVLKFSAMGFNTIEVPYVDFLKQKRKAYLTPDGLQVGEVIVKPKKERYSKKNNPAVELAKRIARTGAMNDPLRNPYFSSKRYESFKMGINNFDKYEKRDPLIKRFSFLREYVDTSEVTGNQVLNLSFREKASKQFHRSNPENNREIVEGFRQEGVDEFMDAENMRVAIEEVFRDINIYDHDINILRSRFVSPLSPLAPDFYKFYITDTIMVDSAKCIELSFVPRNSATFGFTGKMYVEDNDSSLFLHRLTMNVPRDINLNFVERLFIFQDFEKSADGSRLKKRDDMIAEIKFLPGIPEIYAEKKVRFSDFSFEKPDNEADIFTTGFQQISSEKDSSFWAGVRYIPLEDNLSKTSSLMTRLRKDKLYYYGEKVLRLIANGYIPTGKESKFDIGPINSTVSHNHIEGWRFRAGGMTTANLNKHLFARGYAAFGTTDKKWKYNAELEWSFNEKKYHALEFPIHSLKAQYRYDVDMLGQHFAFSNNDNFFLSLRRKKDYQITYRRDAALTYTLELANNFSVEANVKNTVQHATEWMTFITSEGNHYNKYSESSFNIKLRYAPGEKVYQAKSYRKTISKETPIFTLSHTYAPAHAFGNMFELNKTELSYGQRFWLSAFGCVDALIKGGHVWSSAPYPDLLIPNANLSYTIQKEAFALMNPMEFINDSYAQFDLTYSANGAIFNYIPLIKKLKLREAFSLRGMWGHLSDKNNPENNPHLFMFPAISNTSRMTGTPYLEASVGLDNILKILRVDYVWRLTYRNLPGINKHGIRIGMHFTF